MKKSMDMLHGSLGDKIILYTIPLALTAILQQLFNAADVAVVGRFAGTAAMAAVGSNAPVIGLLVNLFVGISLGSNVVIAKSIGQGDKEQVSKAVHTSIIVAVLGGLFLCLFGEVFAGWIVNALGVPADVAKLSEKYLRIYFTGMPVILLYNFESAILRSCGNTRTPLMALSFSGVLNVLLNVFFVVVLGKDVEGVAIATVLSNLVSSSILFISLLRNDTVVKVDIKKLRIHWKILGTVLKIGVPAGIQSMMFSFANIIIQSSINSLGTTVMAASSAGFNLEIFACNILVSYGQTCTTFVGQNYGAKQPDRCKRTLRLCIIQSAIATAIACCLILFFSKTLLGLFTSDPEVIALATLRLRYIFFAYTFSFLQDVLSGYLRGFGMSIIPACCAVVCICGVRLLWIFTVFQRYPSFATIMTAYPLSLGITAVAMVIITIIVNPTKRYL